jgi:hypothetical protein
MNKVKNPEHVSHQIIALRSPQNLQWLSSDLCLSVKLIMLSAHHFPAQKSCTYISALLPNQTVYKIPLAALQP